MTTEITDAKKLVEEIKGTWESYKKSIDEKYEEIKRSGKVSAEVAEKIAKHEERMGALDGMKSRLDAIEVAMKRAPQLVDKEGKALPEDHLEAKEAMNRFLRKGIGGNASEGNSQEFRYARKDGQKSLSVQSDPDGGFMVTADMSGRVVQRIFETSPMRAICSVQVIGTSDRLEGGYDDNEADCEWADGETVAGNETSTPQVGKWIIPVHTMKAKNKATQQLLEDANIDVEAWLAKKTADKMARKEATAFVKGTGKGQPRGFLDYASGTTLRKQIERIGSGVSGGFAPDKLIDVIQSLKEGYRAKARWVMNRLSVAKIRQLKDNQNQYLWVPGLAAGASNTLLGHPITEMADMPDPAASSLSVAFGDFAEGYQIVDRVGIRILRDPFTAEPFVLFKTYKRVGGDVINTEAIKIHYCG